MRFRLRTLLIQFTIRDLLWLMVVASLLFAFIAVNRDREQLKSALMDSWERNDRYARDLLKEQAIERALKDELFKATGRRWRGFSHGPDLGDLELQFDDAGARPGP